MIYPPTRHPLVRRRTAPAGRARKGPGPWSLFAPVHRGLSRTAAGRWLRRRVERGLEVSQVDVPLGRGDSALHGLRIAFLSDLHAGMYMDAGDLCTLFSRVAAERPDLVCFGGDLIDSRPEEMLHYREALRLLEPPLGVYAVPGNHEYLAEPDLKLFHGVLSEAGVRVLLNEGERVHYEGGSLWLAGVDDHWQGQPDLGMAMHGSDPDEPVVLLSHHPDLFYESASIGVDLTLSGHTHGGQIVIGGRTPCRHTKLGYWRGHFADAGAQLYVSRGAGVTVLPIRLGAPAEVPVLRLRRE